MAYTKQISRHDKITIDGTDVSNSFNAMGRPSEHSQEDVSGFSATGFDEFLPGSTAQSFVGTAYYTEELGALVEPLHAARTSVPITWQPDGLNDATREIYSGNCIIMTWSPSNTRGAVATMDFLALPADSAGITVSDWT